MRPSIRTQDSSSFERSLQKALLHTWTLRAKDAPINEGRRSIRAIKPNLQPATEQRYASPSQIWNFGT